MSPAVQKIIVRGIPSGVDEDAFKRMLHSTPTLATNEGELAISWFSAAHHSNDPLSANLDVPGWCAILTRGAKATEAIVALFDGVCLADARIPCSVEFAPNQQVSLLSATQDSMSPSADESLDFDNTFENDDTYVNFIAELLQTEAAAREIDVTKGDPGTTDALQKWIEQQNAEAEKPRSTALVDAVVANWFSGQPFPWEKSKSKPKQRRICLRPDTDDEDDRDDTAVSDSRRKLPNMEQRILLKLSHNQQKSNSSSTKRKRNKKNHEVDDASPRSEKASTKKKRVNLPVPASKAKAAQELENATMARAFPSIGDVLPKDATEATPQTAKSSLSGGFTVSSTRDTAQSKKVSHIDPVPAPASKRPPTTRFAQRPPS